MAKVSKSESNEVVLNLDSFIVPLSIVLAGVIIAGAIYFTNKGSVDSATTDNTGDTDTAQPEEFPAANTTIDDDAYLGDRDKAKVAIVEFSDYECPYCQRHFNETNTQLIEQYVDTGKAILVFRDFPLSFHDPKATLEAMAAECARSLSDDETYFEYHDLIFTNTPANGTGLSNEVLAGYATQLGLSADKFNTCLNEEQFKDEIAKDLQDGSEAGISGTPAFVIGTLDKDGKVTGKLIAGAYPFDSFAAILDEYLK